MNILPWTKKPVAFLKSHCTVPNLKFHDAISVSLVTGKSTSQNTTNRAPSCTSVMRQLIANHNLEEAHLVFNRIPHPNARQYTMMINGYSNSGCITDAFKLFHEMSSRDIVSWNSMMKGCLNCREIRLAKGVFAKMSERNAITWTIIVDGLTRMSRVNLAEDLFHKMPSKDVVSWNSMISGYCINGRITDAILLFEKMPCRNVISWTAMISGLVQNGDSKGALIFFHRMVVSGFQPTFDTYASVLSACAKATDLYLGIQIHTCTVKLGAISDTYVSTSLGNMYANCGQIKEFNETLHEDQHKSVVSWTALITGYGLNGEQRYALQAFDCMKSAGILPNQSTFTSILNLCGIIEDVDRGKEIHGSAAKLGYGHDVFVGNSLIFMYSKCGLVDDAVVVFKNLDEKNIVSWNSIITGCAQNGLGLRSLEFFKHMLLNFVQPDEITYLGLLNACSHSEMVEEAKHFYEMLCEDPIICLKLEHCSSMVDVLCRSGNLEEAEEFINKMPIKPNVAIWLSLLSACRENMNIDMAAQAAEKIFLLEPDCSAAYVLLSNMYASVGQWDNVSRIRVMMKCRRISKQPGCSGMY